VYLRPLWRRVAVLAVLLFSGIGLQLVNPQIVRYFIDTAQVGGSTHALTAAALVFIAVVIAQQAMTVGETYLSESVAWTATNRLRRDLAEHCLRLDMRFHNVHTPGELIERIDGDVTTLANFFSEFVLQVVGNVLLMVGVLVMLYRVDLRVGGAITVFVLVVLVVLNRLRGISIPPWVEGRKASAEMAGFLEERLAGTEDIRASRATDYVMGQFYRLMRDIYLSYRRAYITGAIASTFSRLSLAIGIAIALGLGSYLYIHHEISLGSVYMTSYYAAIMGWPLYGLTDQLNDLQQATAGLVRVRLLRDAPPGVQDGPGASLSHGPATVHFDGVTFAYRDDEPVLDDVSFEVPAGEIVGLLGRTGSGKTTISRLLFRLYDPQAGTISFSGVDIRGFALDDLRSRVGLVTQDVQLFHATVRDNLTFFDSRVSDGEVLGAIETLGLEDWYRGLPQGLDTELAGSSGLSAGEAQLLALTRVFLKNPDVVVLDEASSRLDPVTEALMEGAVETLLRNRTAIIIAHRLSTVMRADSIVILSDGRVVETGRRAALAADSGSRFAELLRTGLEVEAV
jgi:ABC-type multidrug transport system fused ATPase/permease subunit